jgi:hypothetical protein
MPPSRRPLGRLNRRATALARCALLAVLGLSATACGAGLIAGAIAGSSSGGGGSNPGSVGPTPAVVVNIDEGPISNEGLLVVRTVRVTNNTAPFGQPNPAQLGLQILGAGVVDEQEVFETSGPDNAPEFQFLLRTPNIRAAVGGVDVDVPAELRVVDQSTTPERVVAATSLLLRRQPLLDIVSNVPDKNLAVHESGERARVRVQHLADLQGDVNVVVSVPNVDATPLLQPLIAPNVTVVEDPDDSDTKIVSFDMPEYSFASRASVAVVGTVSGRSTTSIGLYYRPLLQAVVERRSDTGGGGTATLIGTGLARLDLVSGQPDFRDVELTLRKGGRERVLTIADFLPTQSSRNNLVFTLPPSPDGLPGSVDVGLRLAFDDIPSPIESQSKPLFFYGAAEPSFEPRGLALSSTTRAVATTSLMPGMPADAFVLELAPDLSARVTRLRAQGNGMFTRRGAPIPVADPLVRLGRDPGDLVPVDLDDDGLTDFVVFENRPNDGSMLISRFVDADPDRLTFAGRPASLPGPTTWRAALPRPGRDLVVSRDGLGALSITSLLDGPMGSVGSLTRQIDTTLVTGAPIPTNSTSQVVEVGDFDGDGLEDVAAAALVPATEPPGAVALEISTWWGAQPSADDVFAEKTVDLVTVPGLQLSDDPSLEELSRIGGPASLSLAVSIDSDAGTVMHAAQTSEIRRWSTISAGTAQTAVPRASTSFDVDQDGALEVASLYDTDCEQQLSIWRMETTGEVIATELGYALGEQLSMIHGLSSGPIGSEAHAGVPRHALFAHFEAEVAIEPEGRITTLLIEEATEDPGTISLVSPIARRDYVDDVLGIVVADTDASTPGTRAPTIVSLHAQSVGFATVDALGNPLETTTGLSLSAIQTPQADVEPIAVPRGGGASDLVLHLSETGRVVACDVDRLGTVDAVTESPDLRTLLGPDALGQPILSASRLRFGDVDGDDITDVILLLVLDDGSQHGLILLRGIQAPGDGSLIGFPFVVPTAVSPLARLPFGVPTDFAIGNLFPENDGPVDTRTTVDEVAVAFQGEIRFLAFDPDGDFVLAEAGTSEDFFRPESAPDAIATADVDGDGLDDLLVASSAAASLRAYLNFTRAEDGGVAVDQLFPRGAVTLPEGTPSRLVLSDQDGDGIEDVITLLEIESTTMASMRLQCAIASGSGEFVASWQIPIDRVASRPCGHSSPPAQGLGSVSLSDVNSDGIGDLVIGWQGNAAVPIESHTRVLFGSHR